MIDLWGSSGVSLYSQHVAYDPTMLEILSLPPSFGKTIRWGSSEISVNGCASPDEAMSKAIHMAELSGWTNPKWWQFWRTGDTSFESSELSRLKAIGEEQCKNSD